MSPCETCPSFIQLRHKSQPDAILESSVLCRQERHPAGGPGAGLWADRQDNRPHHVRCPLETFKILPFDTDICVYDACVSAQGGLGPSALMRHPWSISATCCRKWHDDYYWMLEKEFGNERARLVAESMTCGLTLP